MKKITITVFLLLFIYSLISFTYAQETKMSTKIQESIKKVAMEYVIFEKNTSTEKVLSNNKEFNWNKTLLVGDSLLVGLDNANNISGLGATIDGKVGRPLSKGKSVVSKYSGFDTVIILLGTNDCGNSTKSFKKNLVNTINTAKQNNPNAEIYVSTMPPINNSKAKKNGYQATNSMVENNNNTIRKTVSEEFVNIIDSYEFLTNNGYSTRDGIHMTDETYKEWFKYIKDII